MVAQRSRKPPYRKDIGVRISSPPPNKSQLSGRSSGGRALGLGPRGRNFEISRPDQIPIIMSSRQKSRDRRVTNAHISSDCSYARATLTQFDNASDLFGRQFPGCKIGAPSLPDGVFARGFSLVAIVAQYLALCDFCFAAFLRPGPDPVVKFISRIDVIQFQSIFRSTLNTLFPFEEHSAPFGYPSGAVVRYLGGHGVRVARNAPP